jgi:hypothetical protein
MFKEQKKMLGRFGCQLVSRGGQYEQTGFLGMKWMPIFGTIGSGVPKICIDPSVSGRKSQTVFHCMAIWLWRCRLPCLYFGEEILFEKKKKVFFRRNFRIF